jgi:hypothetical protein
MVHGSVFSSNINLFRTHSTIGDSNFKRIGYGFRMNDNDQLELIKVATFNDNTSITKKIAVFGYNNIEHSSSNDTNYMAFDEANGISFAGESNNIANIAFLQTTGGTMTGDINMSGNSIYGASNISAVNLTVQNYVVAPGADYAEYMKKEDVSVNFRAGDIVGINMDGQVTNVFANAIHFAIVSTDPSFIGGNPWLSDIPTSTADPSFEEYTALMKQYEKIAFCGRVKVNVVNVHQAQPGSYIVPAANGSGLIESTFVGANYMSFAQYVKSVGHIIALDQDNYPIVIVKC